MLLPTALTRSPAWSPSGQFLAAIRVNAEEWRPDGVCVWDTLNGQELPHLKLEPEIDSLAFASERELVIVCEQGCLLWDIQTNTTTRAIPKRGGRAWAVAISPDRQTLVLGSTPVLAFDFPSGKVRQTLSLPDATGVVWDKLRTNGRMVAAITHRDDSGCNYGFVVLWDLQTGRRLRNYHVAYGEDYPEDLALAPDGQHIAYTNYFKDGLHCFGMDTEEDLEGFKPPKFKNYVCYPRYSHDGTILEVISGGRVVRLDSATGQVVERLNIPAELPEEPDRGYGTSAGSWWSVDPTGTRVAHAGKQEDQYFLEVVNLPASRIPAKKKGRAKRTRKDPH